MSVSRKADFYSNKKLRPNLEIFYTNDEKLSEKLDELSNDLKKGFILYTKRNMERFIQEAYEKEQHVLAIFDSNRIIFNGCFYTTEAFNKDVLRGFYEII